MIYKFRMISGDEKTFLRDYEIDSNQTFLEFHQIIQENLHYDSSQLASFFLTDENWNKGLELTIIDMGNEGGPAAIPMDSVKIKEIIKKKKERLLYVYDILTDNAFFMEVMDIYAPDCRSLYPRCIASLGEPPMQSSMPINATSSFALDDSFEDIFKEFDSQDSDYELGEFNDSEE